MATTPASKPEGVRDPGGGGGVLEPAALEEPDAPVMRLISSWLGLGTNGAIAGASGARWRSGKGDSQSVLSVMCIHNSPQFGGATLFMPFHWSSNPIAETQLAPALDERGEEELVALCTWAVELKV